MEFSNKPTALITASTSGLKGHHALLETLKVIEAKMNDNTQLVISHIKARLDSNGKVVHEETIQKVKTLMRAVKQLIEF